MPPPSLGLPGSRVVVGVGVSGESEVWGFAVFTVVRCMGVTDIAVWVGLESQA